jgi:hypothetical protein
MESSKSSNVNGYSRTRPRRLLLGLDGVPFDVIETARARGLFDQFREPSRLLSPFPTMTNIALSTMFRATPPPGYESLYFDSAAGEMRGGISKYIGRRTPDKIPSSYMDELDYQEPLPFEFLVYVAPEKVCMADFNRFKERFRQAPRELDYFAFLKATDGLLHLRGAENLLHMLRSLDEILRELYRWCGDETEIMLFSDHGMNLQENHRAPLQTHLRRAGFQTTNKLFEKSVRHTSPDKMRVKNGVAIPAFGLCGYAALYCADEDVTRNVADAVIDLEGVDFAIHREGTKTVMVKSARGTARIHRVQHGHNSESENEHRCVRYRYEQVAGDPLRLDSIAQELRAGGLIDNEGYACAVAWSMLTAEHIYPDALANIFGAVQDARVLHTADVLISFEDGYYFGAYAFSRFAPRLLATHGNALRASTNAFLMSTHRQFSRSVRAGDAYALFRGEP